MEFSSSAFATGQGQSGHRPRLLRSEEIDEKRRAAEQPNSILIRAVTD